MKNIFLSFIAVILFSTVAFSQNAKLVKSLDQKGPNGGDVQVYDDKYTIEMKRNSGSIAFYLSDMNSEALTSENELTGAVVVNYSDQTDKSFVLEPGFNLSNIAVDNKDIFMVMIHAIHNGEIFEARYYLKEGQLEQDYEKKMMELQKMESQKAK